MKQRQFKFRVWSGNLFGKESFKHFSFEDIFGCGCPDWDVEKVQQFTGLKDKTGKDVYEGDVLHSFHGEDVFVKVVWIQDAVDCAGWGYMYPIGNRYVFSSERPAPAWSVVGNIFRNPELLTK